MSTLYVDNLEPNLGSRVMTAGHVVQVLQAELNFVNVTTATFVSLGTISITPTLASSKVLISYTNHLYVGNWSTNDWRGGFISLKRDGVAILADGSAGYGEGFFLAGDNDRYMTYSSNQYLDSPSTTSSVTYDVQGSSKLGRTGIEFNNGGYGSGGRITLMEIAQ